MDIELALCMNVKDNGWHIDMLNDLFCGKGSWETRLGYAMDRYMERAGLQAFESYEHGRTVIAYPHTSRRAYPAFIAVSPGYSRKYPDAVFWRHNGVYTIEVVEAGNYAMAGGSEAPKNRRAKEGSALWH